MDDKDKVLIHEDKKTKPCPHCREKVDFQATKCPHCHEYIQGSFRRNRTTIIVVTLVFILLIAVYISTVNENGGLDSINLR